MPSTSSGWYDNTSEKFELPELPPQYHRKEPEPPQFDRDKFEENPLAEIDRIRGF